MHCKKQMLFLLCWLFRFLNKIGQFECHFFWYRRCCLGMFCLSSFDFRLCLQRFAVERKRTVRSSFARRRKKISRSAWNIDHQGGGVGFKGFSEGFFYGFLGGFLRVFLVISNVIS